MINSVVIIDDDPVINEMLVDIVTSRLKVPSRSYFSAEQFFEEKEDNTTKNAIYLVDWNLPGMQGPEIIKAIRLHDKISPIFMISGNHDHQHILDGLKSGADDYLIKPFEAEQLITKIQNASVRCNTIFANHMNHGLKLIPEAALIISDGQKVPLTSREFQVFKILHDQPDEVHSRNTIMSNFIDSETTERNIDVLIFSLRRKISTIGLEIDTVRGQGYRIGKAAN